MGLFRSGRAFDRAEITTPEGRRILTPKEYDALPLDQRVRAILGKQIRFFLGEREIPLKEALDDR